VRRFNGVFRAVYDRSPSQLRRQRNRARRRVERRRGNGR
jgi:hypothetical protein